MTRLYLAGPMSGLPDHNHAAFDTATTALRAFGYEVFSPAEYDRENSPDPKSDETEPGGNDRRRVLRVDIDWILEYADGVALLPDFRDSTGAMAEIAAAGAIPIPVKKYQDWLFEDAALVHYIDGLLANAIGFGSTCYNEAPGTDRSGWEFDGVLAQQGVFEYRDSLFKAVITPLLDEVRNWR